jgi:hypothetical protein
MRRSAEYSSQAVIAPIPTTMPPSPTTTRTPIASARIPAAAVETIVVVDMQA